MLSVNTQVWNQTANEIREAALKAEHPRTRESLLALYEITQGSNATQVGKLTSCSRTKEQLAERVKKVEKGVEVKKQQNNGNYSYTSPDPSLYIARFDADLLSTR